MLDVRSTTFTLRTADFDGARDWYARVLGRPPDLVPTDGVCEWRLLPGTWLQLTPGGPPGGESATLLRLGVDDIDDAAAALAAAGARLGDIERIPGVIAFCDAEDPFGNVLSLYEDLSES